MSINISQYVDITSGVGASAVVPNRLLVGRFFTANPLVPINSFVQFTSAAAVLAYFGSESEEYARASFYFGWISKSGTQPPAIQFARWANVATAPTVYSASFVNANATTLLAAFKAVTAGTLTVVIGGVSLAKTGLNFSSDGTLAAVASRIQSAIQTGTGVVFTSAAVAYNAASGFTLTGGATGNNTISITASGDADIAVGTLLAWLPQQTTDVYGNITAGSIWSPGSAIQDLVTTLQDSSDTSNNFGSFAFLTNLSLTLLQVQSVANWNNANIPNNQYLYSIPVTPANANTWSTAYPVGVGLIGGCSLTLSPVVSPVEYPEQAPMMIAAATDYTQVNAVQNYMFQQFLLTPSVTSTASALGYNAQSINYYGQTQNAGTQFSFYQNGVMQGLPVNPLDQNTYVNEAWLKDAMAVALLNLLLALNEIPANTQGQIQILSTMQQVINQALLNGVISVGKTLTSLQQAYITSETNDPTAWYQVQNSGYWVDVVITSAGSPLIYTATYTLIYSKNDVIRQIVGTNTLI